jgi:hypothetical protein
MCNVSDPDYQIKNSNLSVKTGSLYAPPTSHLMLNVLYTAYAIQLLTRPLGNRLDRLLKQLDPITGDANTTGSTQVPRRLIRYILGHDGSHDGELRFQPAYDCVVGVKQTVCNLQRRKVSMPHVQKWMAMTITSRFIQSCFC